MYLLGGRRLKRRLKAKEELEALGDSLFHRSRHPLFKAYFGLLARNQPIVFLILSSWRTMVTVDGDPAPEVPTSKHCPFLRMVVLFGVVMSMMRGGQKDQVCIMRGTSQMRACTYY